MLEYDLKPSLKKTSTEPKETFNQTWQNPKPTLNKSQTNTMITSNETTCTQHGGAPTRVSHVHMFCIKDRLSTMIKLQRCLWEQVLLWCCFGGRRCALVSALPPISPSLFLILSPSLPACKYAALHWLYMCMHIYLFLTNQSSTYVYIYIHIISLLQFLFLHIVHI